MSRAGLIYKIVSEELWREARQRGSLNGAPVDLVDGYIHFSTAAQLRETAARHFRGERGLVLLVVDPDTLSDALKWEPSRGGDLFPHLYAPLAVESVASERPIDLDTDGVAILPEVEDPS